MSFLISDIIKQRNRRGNIHGPGFFFAMDAFDVSHGVNGFQQPGVAPSTDEFSRYIITNPYDLHADYGTIASVGTGDIVQAVDDQQREIKGYTFEVVMDASNTGDLVSFNIGQIGTRVFNVGDLSSYVFNGATWERVQTGPAGAGSGGGNTYYGGTGLTLTNFVAGFGQTFSVDPDAFLSVAGISINAGGITFYDGTYQSSAASGSGGGSTYYGGTGLTLSNFVANVGQTFSIDPDAFLSVAGISAYGVSTFSGGITLGSSGITFADGSYQKYAGFNKIFIGSAGNILASDYYDAGYSTLVLTNTSSIIFDKGLDSGTIPYITSNVKVDNSTIEIDVSNGLRVKASGIGTSHIADSAVTTAKIATSAVTAAKIADSAVTAAKIATSAVTTAKIATSAVTAAKIASNNVVKSISVSNGVEITSGDGQDSVSIGGINAKADSSTKGVATFKASDFDADDDGLISLSAASGIGPSWYVKIFDTDVIDCANANTGEFVVYPFVPSGIGYNIVASKTDAFDRLQEPSWFDDFNRIYFEYDNYIRVTFRKLIDETLATFTMFNNLSAGFETCNDSTRYFQCYENIDDSGITISSFIGSGATCEITYTSPTVSPILAWYHYKGTNASNPGSSPPGEMTLTSLALPPAGGGTGGQFTLKINNQDIYGNDQRTHNMFWQDYMGDRPFALDVRPGGFSGDNPPRGGFTAGKQRFEINSGTYEAPNFVFTGTAYRFENDGLTAGNLGIITVGFPDLAGFSATGETGPTGDKGTTGVTGPIGNTGSQGIQGTTGNTGAQGIQGVTGNTGSQGIQGTTGNTGAQGIQGVTGNTGSQGIQGTTGNTGAQGIQGVTGNTGSQGIQGVTGNTGSQGIQGVTGTNGTNGIGIGVTGNTGSQGIQGTTGNTGSQGIQGVTGNTGSQGIQGVTGNTGSQGIQGVTGTNGTNGIGIGVTGNTGSQGIQGTTGNTGSQGIQGTTGNTGAQGIQGVTGNTGSQGIQGVTGTNGTNGIGIGVTGNTGSQGIQGTTGNTGSQGIQGTTGNTGSQGIQGTTGNTGAQGIQGVTGNTGSQGIQGVTGTNGTNGIGIGVTGNTGSQGIQGTTGNTGSQGIQGTTGNTGSQGIQGTTGNTGSQGIQGVTGNTGSQGIQGVTGTNGTNGIGIGVTGNTGSQGIQGTTGNTGSQGIQGVTGNTGSQGIQGVTGKHWFTGYSGCNR
jgi:hypothetical protein